MNKKQAIAYAIMTIYTLQNSASGDYKLKDIKLLDIKQEMNTMFNIYNLDNIIEISNKKIG